MASKGAAHYYCLIKALSYFWFVKTKKKKERKRVENDNKCGNKENKKEESEKTKAATLADVVGSLMTVS